MKNLTLTLALLALLPACQNIMKKDEACQAPVVAVVEEEIDIEEDGDDTADTEEEGDEQATDEAQARSEKECEPVPGCASCCK